MTVPQKLSAMQVQEAGLADWRQILGRLKARFRTSDLTSGMTLTNRIGQLATAAQAHLEITVTPGDVVITLSTPEVRGITAPDLDLARQISEAAAKLDVSADVSGLTQLELGLDLERHPVAVHSQSAPRSELRGARLATSTPPETRSWRAPSRRAWPAVSDRIRTTAELSQPGA